MLILNVDGMEYLDSNNEFHTIKPQTLTLEHSLVSISKWESKWHKPFISKDPKTHEELMDYIRCMTLTTNVDPNIYLCLSAENMKAINEYIEDSMTATWFSEKNQKKAGKEVITSELIYYWMVAFQIPFECQKWHLNRLMTLIRICSIKNQPPKKMSKKDIYSKNRSLNAARRMAMNSSG